MNVHGSPPPPAGPPPRCPDCRAPLPVRPRGCPRCGLLLIGGTAQRLWWIDSEIALLDARRQRLQSERAAVVRLLREESAQAAARPGPQAEAHVGAAGAAQSGTPGRRPPEPVSGPAPAAAAHRREGAPAGEVTRRSAQNVILGLGGLLIGISALVFAIWTWSDMGTGTRAGVLGLTTASFAALALPLHRRGLRATAETFGCLAAALLCVDALALWLLMPDRFGNGPGYTAAALAAVGSLTALYPLLVPLRAPRVLTVLLCQPVPVLLVVSLAPVDMWPWTLPALAATALGDLLLARWIGEPRPGLPVRALHVTATVLWAAALLLAVVLVFSASGSVDLGPWLALSATLLLAGTTGLLFARRPRASASTAAGDGALTAFHTAAALAALAMVPLAAGPAHLPVLPRMPADPWGGAPSSATAPVLQVLGLSGPPNGPLHLAAVLTGAVLSLGAVALLRRKALVPAAALAAPPTLLALPLLLGLPHVVATVWALSTGAALVLGASLPRRRSTALVPAATGTLTLATGLLWSLPGLYTSLAALLFLGATALVTVLLCRRAAAGGAPAPVPYGTGLLLWALGLPTGAFFALGLVISETVPPPAWWLLAAGGLFSGATALVLGRVPVPFARPGRAAPDPRPLFTLLGLLLLPAVPLLVGRGQSPGLPVLPRAEPWSKPASAMSEPAYSALGLTTQAGLAAAAGTAAGVLVAGAAVVALAGLLDRRRMTAAAALTAPPALVPLPLLLGLPYAAAVVWTVLVGATLVLGVAPAARHGLGWVPALSGLLTLGLGLLWALPEWYTTLAVLVLVAATALAQALVLRRLDALGNTAPVPLVYAAVLVLGALTLFPGLVALADTFARGAAADPVAWWLLAAALLLIASASVVLARVPYPWPAAGPARPSPAAPAPRTSPFTVVGVLLLAAAPLVAGPRSLPALAALSRVHPPASAPPSALTEPAQAFLGLTGVPEAAAVAAGVLLSGLLAVGATALLARRWTAAAAALTAPPALVPLPVVLDAPFAVALVWTFAVGSALALWSALTRERLTGLLTGATGLLTLVLGWSWALAQEHANTGALMAVAVVGSVVAALARTPVPAVGATAVATAATGAFALSLPLLLGAPVEYAALAPIAMVAAVAVAAPRLHGPLMRAAEVPACLWAVAALVTTVSSGARPELVALALAVVGVIALATAVRPHRRWSALVGALLMLAALWTVLAAWDVAVPEAYTVPPALAALAVGWEWSRRAVRTPSSWSAYGGGLALLFLPTVALVLGTGGMEWRVPAVLVLGLAVTVWGLRGRLQAALALGGLALVATSLRAFGPPLWDLARLAPNWVPFALAGALLLVIGARYEASLERLRRLGRLVARMR